MEENNFYSINRLVEFGLGMAVAQQMIEQMNMSIKQMKVPGAMNEFPDQKTELIYVIINGKQSGPFSEPEMSRLIQEQQVTNTSYVWKPGMTNWDIAENVPSILRLVLLSPPPFTIP
ncbi:MAG: DUF4339 domain-containing protein [Crocinitomicaceae bacterium]